MTLLMNQTMSLLGMTRTLHDGPPKFLFLTPKQHDELRTVRTRFGRERPFTLLWSESTTSRAAIDATLREHGLNGAVIGEPGRALFYSPEGGSIELGTVAELAPFIRRRAAVRWFRTVEDPTLDLPVGAPSLRNAEQLLAFAQSSGLLYDRNGNLAVRAQNITEAQCTTEMRTHLLISPRGVDKSALRADELCHIELDAPHAQVHCKSLLRKSSIDSGVLATLFSRFPALCAALHFHPGEALVLPQTKTDFPYPCGTMEEADELERALHSAGNDSDAVLVEMVHHGYLLAMSEQGARTLLAEWAECLHEHEEHLRHIEQIAVLSTARRYPILNGGRAIGVYLRHSDGWGSIYLRVAARGRRCAVALAEEVARRKVRIAAHERCRVKGFYLKLGWSLVRVDGETSYLDPPKR